MPRIDNDIKLDFKDVLLRPKRSTLKSRADVSTNEYLTEKCKESTDQLTTICCRLLLMCCLHASYNYSALLYIEQYSLLQLQYRFTDMLVIYSDRICSTFVAVVWKYRQGESRANTSATPVYNYVPYCRYCMPVFQCHTDSLWHLRLGVIITCTASLWLPA